MKSHLENLTHCGKPYAYYGFNQMLVSDLTESYHTRFLKSLPNMSIILFRRHINNGVAAKIKTPIEHVANPEDSRSSKSPEGLKKADKRQESVRSD